MPDIETLGILTINCNIIETKEADSSKECKTDTSQEIDGTEKCFINKDNISEFENEDKPIVTDNDTNSIKYFLTGPNSDNNKRVSAEITQQIQREFKDVFSGIGCFNGTFSLQVKPDSKPYQAPPRHIAYALQQPFKEELECLQQQDIIAVIGVQ